MEHVENFRNGGGFSGIIFRCIFPSKYRQLKELNPEKLSVYLKDSTKSLDYNFKYIPDMVDNSRSFVHTAPSIMLGGLGGILCIRLSRMRIYASEFHGLFVGGIILSKWMNLPTRTFTIVLISTLWGATALLASPIIVGGYIGYKVASYNQATNIILQNCHKRQS